MRTFILNKYDFRKSNFPLKVEYVEFDSLFAAEIYVSRRNMRLKHHKWQVGGSMR